MIVIIIIIIIIIAGSRNLSKLEKNGTLAAEIKKNFQKKRPFHFRICLATNTPGGSKQVCAINVPAAVINLLLNPACTQDKL